MADRDAVGTDEDFLDEEPEDLLALLDGRAGRRLGKPREKAFEALG